MCDEKPRNYQKEWREDGCVTCPGCGEIISQEDNEQLVYCDNCGYRFDGGGHF